MLCFETVRTGPSATLTRPINGKRADTGVRPYDVLNPETCGLFAPKAPCATPV